MNFSDRVKTLMVRRNLSIERKEELTRDLEFYSHKVDIYTKVLDIITLASTMTQEGVKETLENCLTPAIQSVYNDKDLEFFLELNISKNSSIAKPWIKENDNLLDPSDECSGGLLELLSFAMRVILWSLQETKTRPIFVLDEPMTALGGGELMERASEILSSLRDELGIQILIVTHIPTFSHISDKSYRFEKKNKIAHSEEM